MKPLPELQRLAASKLPEKIFVTRQTPSEDDNTTTGYKFYWSKTEIAILDTEWPYIVQELLEPMMTPNQARDYVIRLREITTCDFDMIHLSYSQRLTAMDEIGFFEKGTK